MVKCYTKDPKFKQVCSASLMRERIFLQDPTDLEFTSELKVVCKMWQDPKNLSGMSSHRYQPARQD